jgi:hypothetical protein
VAGRTVLLDLLSMTSDLPDSLDEPGAVALLRHRVIEAGSVEAWARVHGFSATGVYHVLAGRRAVGRRIAAALGLRITRRFVSGRHAIYSGVVQPERRPTVASTAIVKLNYPHNDAAAKVDTLCADPEYQKDFLAAVEAVGKKHGAKHGLNLTGPVTGKLLDLSHS